MNILKFGGTSVACAQNIEKTISIINKIEGNKIVVVSALGGVTDALIDAIKNAQNANIEYEKILKEIENRHYQVISELLAKENRNEITLYVRECFSHINVLLEGCFLLGEISDKVKDILLSYGELLSAKIIYEKLKEGSKKVRYIDSRQLISTNSNFGNALINFEITDYSIQHYFEKNHSEITILPGFLGEDSFGNTTTLGRGGSDYTASIIAAALNADELQIWTDVSGVFTANPKIVKQAKPIDLISYREAMELSYFGAKVLYAPTIQPALNRNIPIVVKNTFLPEDEGTLISDKENKNPKLVKGITHIENIALITLEGSGLMGVFGTSKRLFEVIAKEKINVVFITQASSEYSICIGILKEEAEKAKQIIDEEFINEIKQFKIKPVLIETNLSIIAVVGENMKNHQGLSGKIFSVLGRNKINVRAIAQGASERNISAVIDEKDINKALNSLHEEFFEDNLKKLNLFISGVGNVGSKFIEQVYKQHSYLKDVLKIDISIVALSNSRKMYFNEEGISLENWTELLQEGEVACMDEFISKAEKLNLHNSVFIDITDNESVASVYDRFLKQNISVVTCNKIACSSEYENYRKLKLLSKKFNAPFLFETNVGAGLPIIDTIKNLVASGDKVHEIQAVLSGSLNFIFNNFNDNCSFYDVVKLAGIEGYTEPDPKIDLSGVDVMRKILILIRESGYEMEIDQIENISFLPKEVLQTKSIDDFYKSLEEHEDYFKKIFKNAEDKNSRLKYVAEFKDGNARVGLQFIEKEHPFYNLDGKDNIVLFFTDRYCDQPLIIKGAGAGASVTASGIFADVIRLGNN